MLLNLWNYLRGYVIIEVTGFSVERFVNLATFKGVYIWDMETAENSVRMKVSIKAFRLLKTCGRKTDCRIKIVGKVGYPFVAHKYRKRKILIGGCIFFILMLYFLSSFIWLIEVNGNDRITDEVLLGFVNEQGLRIGAFKRSIDKKEIENNLVHNFPDISWINIEVRGTKAQIDMTEIIPKQDLVDRNTPSNIVASKTGLITNIVTSAGTPLVKENDVVSKGDKLVSGELIIKDDETGTMRAFVNSEAEIWAKMYYELNYSVPFAYTVKQYTGQTKDRYRLVIFERKFNEFGLPVNFENYTKETSRRQFRLSENYPLPFIIVTETYKEFIPVEKIYSLKQVLEVSEQILNNRIIREFDFEVDIIDKQMIYIETQDGIDVFTVVTTLERIDEKQPIDMTQFEDLELPEEELQQQIIS